MNGIEISATFPASENAHEAEHKLQALRVTDVAGGADGRSFTATVDAELVDRALHLIRQTGGTAES